MEIDILCPLGLRADRFLPILMQSAKIFCSKRSNLHWKGILAGYNGHVPKEMEIVGEIDADSHPSVNHGRAINAGISKTTCRYVLITHVDILILLKKWDQLLVKRMKIKGSKAIGISNPQLLTPFPEPALFCLYDGRLLRSLLPNFEPNFKEERQHLNFEFVDPAIYGTPIKKADTGWQVPSVYATAGYKATTLPFQSIKRYNQVFMFGDKPLLVHCSHSVKKLSLIHSWQTVVTEALDH